MKIERRETKQEGTIQITTYDERWYLDEKNFPNKPFKNVTWISGCFPKGVPFYKWLAQKGWDEAESIKKAAGEKGSRVHKAIEVLLLGQTVNMNDSFAENEDGLIKELSVEEWEAIMSFTDWYKATKPEVLATEQIVFNKDLWYAGTMDFKCRIGEDVWIIDFKTSQHLWPEHELQLTGYRHCGGMEDVTKMGVLQIGYRLNKRHWKLTEMNDKWNLFLAAHEIWNELYGNVTPRQHEYPTTLSLTGESNAQNQ